MKHMAWFCLASLLAFAGCDSDAGPRCQDVESQCENGMLLSCDEATGELAPATACETGNICRGTACEPISAEMLDSGNALAQYAQAIEDYTAQMTLDISGPLLAAQNQYYISDGSAFAFATAVMAIFNASYQGHTLIGFDTPGNGDCNRNAGSPFAFSLDSYFGACTRIAGDDIVVTYVAPDPEVNRMALGKGDRIVALKTLGSENLTGQALLDRLAATPLCQWSVPNDSARLDTAAANLFAVLEPGEVISVVSPSGDTRDITVPARSDWIGCYDGASRPEFNDEMFKAYQRPDGVVIVVMSTFGSHPDHPFPSPLNVAAYTQWITESIELVTAAITAFEDVTGLVYDVRGNRGGAQEYAMALLAQLPATEGAIGNCYARVPMSSPPTFSDEAEYPFPYDFLAGDVLPPPPITALGNIRQAVVTDGFSASATDWMAHYAQMHDIPVIGRPASGSYGYRVNSSCVVKDIAPVNANTPGIYNYISGARCLDGAGMPLEGVSSVDVAVELNANDVANGVDTQLEAAAALVLAP